MSQGESKPVAKKESTEARPRARRKPDPIPRRAPSIVVPPRQIIFITPEKTTCIDCTCFPKEDPYVKPKKLNPCQSSPLTLYEYASEVVDGLPFPDAFKWDEQQVAAWMADDVELPEYKECIIDNHINGRRLLLLEDPSHLAAINIKNMQHIQVITAKVRELFGTEFIKFSRSIGLPPRKPLTHCTGFKSRTGPTWGIRQNFTRSDILRWMKIIMPKPLYLDHWDLVWYHKPDFPKVKFARIPPRVPGEAIPHYKPTKIECKEYLAPRKFRLQRGIPESEQFIWMERVEVPREREEPKRKKARIVPKDTRLYPKKISLEGLAGEKLILARRLMPKKKFLP